MLVRECQLLDPDSIIDKKDRTCRFCHKNKKTVIRTDSTYKESILAKVETFNLFVSNCILSGSALVTSSSDENAEPSETTKSQFIYFLRDITGAQEITYNKVKALQIQVEEPVITEDDYTVNMVTLVIPNLENISEIASTLLSARDEFLEELQEERQKYGIKAESEAQAKRALEQERRAFFEDQYSSHITDPEFPIYIFDEDKAQRKLSLMYIDENQNLNFLAINGNELMSAHGYIPYKNISYFDKPSAVALNASNEDAVYGGSFAVDTSTLTTEMLNGLLFSSMGMREGIMEGYVEPETYVQELKEDSEQSSSEIYVMNVYSDILEQYVNIEFPQEMFEFFESHLESKKYDISKEIDKAISVAVSNKLKALLRKGILTEAQFEAEMQDL